MQKPLFDTDDVKCSSESRSMPLLVESPALREDGLAEEKEGSVGARDAHGKLERQDTPDSVNSDVKDSSKPKRRSFKKTLSGVFSFRSSNGDASDCGQKQDSSEATAVAASNPESKKEPPHRRLMRRMSSDSKLLQHKSDSQSVETDVVREDSATRSASTGRSGLFSRSKSGNQSLAAPASEERTVSNWGRKGLKSFLRIGGKGRGSDDAAQGRAGVEGRRGATARPRSSTMSTTDDEDSDDGRGHTLAVQTVAAAPPPPVVPPLLGISQPHEATAADGANKSASPRPPPPTAAAATSGQEGDSNVRKVEAGDAREDEDILTGPSDAAFDGLAEESNDVSGDALDDPIFNATAKAAVTVSQDRDKNSRDILVAKSTLAVDRSQQTKPALSEGGNDVTDGQPKPTPQQTGAAAIRINKVIKLEPAAAMRESDEDKIITRVRSRSSSGNDAPQTPEGRNFRETAATAKPESLSPSLPRTTGMPTRLQTAKVETKPTVDMSIRPAPSFSDPRSDQEPHPGIDGSINQTKKSEESQHPSPQRKSLSCQIPGMQTSMFPSRTRHNEDQDDDEQSEASSVDRQLPVRPVRSAAIPPVTRDEFGEESAVGSDLALQSPRESDSLHREHTGNTDTGSGRKQPFRNRYSAEVVESSDSRPDQSAHNSRIQSPQHIIGERSTPSDFRESRGPHSREAPHSSHPPIPPSHISHSRGDARLDSRASRTHSTRDNRYPSRDDVADSRGGVSAISESARERHTTSYSVAPNHQDSAMSLPAPPPSSRLALENALHKSRHHFLANQHNSGGHESPSRPADHVLNVKNRTGLLLGDKVHAKMLARKGQHEGAGVEGGSDDSVVSQVSAAPYPESVLRVFPHLTPPPKVRTRREADATSPLSPSVRLMLDVHDNNRRLGHREHIVTPPRIY
jgi:hypothetical protein